MPRRTRRISQHRSREHGNFDSVFSVGRRVFILTAAAVTCCCCCSTSGGTIRVDNFPGVATVSAFSLASTGHIIRPKRRRRHAAIEGAHRLFSSAIADPPILTSETDAKPDTTTARENSNSQPPPPPAKTPAIHPDLIARAITNSVKQRGSESYRRSYNRWSSTALGHIQHQLAHSLPVAPDADATAQLGFELGVAADNGAMPSFGHGGARAGYALDYFCRVTLLGDVLFGERMNGWRSNEQRARQLARQREEEGDQQQQSSSTPSYLGGTITDMMCNPKREVVRIGSLGGGPGFDHVAATVLATHAALEREVQQCIDTSAGASLGLDDDEEEDGLPRIEVEDVLSHLASRTAPSMPRIETTVYEYEKGWDEIIPYMEQSTQSVLDFGPHHRCTFAGCDITVPLTHHSNDECLEQAQTTDLWICSYCVAENAIRLRANDYQFFVDLFDAAKEGAVFIFTETTHRLWPEIVDVATKANNESESVASGFDVAFPRIQRGRGKAGFQLALRKRAGATLGDDVQTTCKRFRRDNAMHELKISGGYKRQKRKIRGAK